MRLQPSRTGLSQVAFNVIMELVQLAMLLSNNCVSNIERDNFRRCRTTERRSKKLVAETQEIDERLQELETRLRACVDTRVDSAIKATCVKVDESSAEVLDVQLKNSHCIILQ